MLKLAWGVEIYYDPSTNLIFPMDTFFQLYMHPKNGYAFAQGA